MKVLIVFFSVYGHIYRMAEAVAQGVREVKGAKMELRRVLEITIISTHLTLLHQEMVLVGLPYTFEEQSRIDEITGCSPPTRPRPLPDPVARGCPAKTSWRAHDFRANT